MGSTNRQDSSSNASASPGKDNPLYPILKLLPSLQEQRGDHKLEQACKISRELGSDIAESDREVIKEKIALAEETKQGLDSKSALSPAKFRQSHEYRKAASKAYQFAKRVSVRVQNEAEANDSSSK